jgi:hypothetical protein
MLFFLGSFVKWTSSYFADANWEPCLDAHSYAFWWIFLSVLQLCCANWPIANIDTSSMYPITSVSGVLQTFMRFAL